MLTPNGGLDKILPAIANVKKELETVKKSANNPFYKSKYADLNTHLAEVEKLMDKNGLILLQPVEAYPDANIVKTIIYHVGSGQSVSSSMKLVGETDMQKAGSAITYARRYSLSALLAMQAEDDDGNVASSKQTTESKKTTKTNKKNSFAPKTETSGDEW